MLPLPLLERDETPITPEAKAVNNRKIVGDKSSQTLVSRIAIPFAPDHGESRQAILRGPCHERTRLLQAHLSLMLSHFQ